jgi:hypothetical protein
MVSAMAAVLVNLWMISPVVFVRCRVANDIFSDVRPRCGRQGMDETVKNGA